MSDTYPNTFDDQRRKAEEALGAGDAREAFAALRFALEYPGETLEAHWEEALLLFGRIADVLTGDDLGELARAAAANPSDDRALYTLGYQLIEHGLDGFAASVLAHAHRVAPQKPAILSELSCALERADRHDAAFRVLGEARALVEGDFLLRYLFAFNALMSGALEASAREVPVLLARAEGNDQHFMAGALAEMHARAQAIRSVTSLDRQDLRGWHFVVNGALLTHLSPYGFDEGMSGRYAFTQDSEARCKAGIQRLGAVLEALGAMPPRVFLLEDRDSVALGHAAARLLNLRAEPWPSGGSDLPGLLVAYDLDALDTPVLKSIHPHRPGQILFAHASKSTEDFPLTADFGTYLFQFNTSPWGARLRVNPETKQAEQTAASEESPEALAGKVLLAEVTPEDGGLDDTAKLLALAKAAAALKGEAAAGALMSSGNRRRFRKDSPVKSSRFL